MNFHELLELGVHKEIITSEQKIELLNLITNTDEEAKQTPIVVKILYYIGGFIMLCAMFSLMSQTIQHSTYIMILALGTFYAALFGGIGEFLWKRNETFPAGILYFLFITTVSFIILDLEKMIGFFPHFAKMYIYPNYFDMCRFPLLILSTFTIIANTYLQKYRKTDLLTIPIIGCSYAIYTVLLHFIFGDKIFGTTAINYYNLVFSLGLFIVAFIKDSITKLDYSKWMYLCSSFGIMISVLMLFCIYDLSLALTQFLLFVVFLIYCFIGIFIKRKSFSIIGILGVIEYLIYLEFNYLENNTLLLTSTIIATGLLILYAGVLYNKNIDKFTEYVISKLPAKVQKYLPQNRF